MERDRKIIQTSVIGIVTNVLLAAFKAAVGLLSHSVAVVLDAVNNLSDALSSLITILGTKLAAKEPDKKHPLGYGRVEYLSATVIAVIVLYAGVTSLVESVKKILQPETPDYSLTALVIIGVAVGVKLLLGRHVRRVGREVDSDSLVASGTDAMFDSIVSASTLLAAVLYLTLGLRLEAWLGAVISLVILKSGLEMLRDTVSQLLGERVDAALAGAVKETICAFPAVSGAYDLVIHSYGPTRQVGSVHIEVPDDMTARELDALEREITRAVFLKTQVVMTGISVYAQNTGAGPAAEMQRQVRALLAGYPEVLQLHGFYVDEAAKALTFDIILDYDAPDRRGTFAKLQQETQALFPDYHVHISLDFDISD